MTETIEVNAIAVSSQELTELMPDLVERYRTIGIFAKNVLNPDIDFGKIPGVKKHTLFLPGAQKIRDFFSFHVENVLEKEIEDWDGQSRGGEPFFYYRFKATVYRQGRPIASSYGSCNSWEKKYRYRESKRVCPNCGSDAILKSKNDGGGWFCWAKKGGCGATFSDRDPAIANQKTGLEKNPEIYELPNTLIKMAQKRAFISAIVYASGLSEFFSFEGNSDLVDSPDRDSSPSSGSDRQWDSLPPKEKGAISKEEFYARKRAKEGINF